jgi:hypothetical protein
MELSTSWKAANCAATQEIPSILWNPKVHHRVQSPHWSKSWARTIQSIPSHPISLRFILILSTLLRLGLPIGLFPSHYPTNILYAFFFVLHALLISSSLTWRRVRVMKLYGVHIVGLNQFWSVVTMTLSIVCYWKEYSVFQNWICFRPPVKRNGSTCRVWIVRTS